MLRPPHDLVRYPGDNDYPNSDNQPTTSFRTPIPPPDVDPDEGELISVAYNPLWAPVLMAAVNQLLMPSTYLGTHDEIILALNRAANLQWLLQNPVTSSGFPTPFWDEGQDVDDQEPASTQTWYGEVPDAEAPADDLDFVEQAGIWIITGFIAYSGNIGAAIFFHTIANSFVLAFNRGDVGEIWRVIVDSAEYGRVDTSAAATNEVVELPVAAGDGEHDIYLVKVE